MTDPADLRPAVPADAAALASLERAANLLGLAHVFPADEHPYPMAEVEDRWRRVLGDPDVAVDVAEDRLGLLAFVAYDEEVLRHLGVRPDAWGGGLGRALVGTPASRMGPAPRLWCLVDNHPRPVALRAARLAGDRRRRSRPSGRRTPSRWSTASTS